MTHINWLRLSDLRISTQRSMLFEPEMREEVERDLRTLHASAGPWDAVIVTGNLTEKGAWREFDRVELIFEWLFAFLAQLGSTPVLLAVPGAHDALWSRSLAYAGLIKESSGGTPERLTPHTLDPLLWDAVLSAFEPFAEWYAKRRPASARTERVPGDFVHTLDRDRQRLTVLGLNSAFLQIGPLDTNDRLEVDTRFPEGSGVPCQRRRTSVDCDTPPVGEAPQGSAP